MTVHIKLTVRLSAVPEIAKSPKIANIVKKRRTDGLNYFNRSSKISWHCAFRSYRIKLKVGVTQKSLNYLKYFVKINWISETFNKLNLTQQNLYFFKYIQLPGKYGVHDDDGSHWHQHQLPGALKGQSYESSHHATYFLQYTVDPKPKDPHPFYRIRFEFLSSDPNFDLT